MLSSSLRVLGVVPARLKSTRLPDKMLADLHGRPMIAVTAASARNSAAFSQVVVATDSQRIVDAVEGYGFKAFLTDPELTSGTARVAEVAKQIDADVYVNIQGDEPLIDGEGLRRVVDSFVEDSVEMASLWFPLTEEDEKNPNTVKVVLDAQQFALYFSRSLIPFPRNWDLFDPKKHLGVYGYRRDTLLKLVELESCDLERIESLEQLKALYYGIRIKMVRAARDSLGVDTHADLEKVRQILKSRHDQGNTDKGAA